MAAGRGRFDRKSWRLRSFGDKGPNAVRRTIIDSSLAVALAAIAVLQFGLFPLLFPAGGAADLALIAVVVLTAPLHYGFMHETMHARPFTSEAWNRRIGRALGITLGLPWETMRFGHLSHHSLNRHKYDCPEHREPNQAWLSAALVYYGKLLIGNELIYVAVPLVLLPRWSVSQRLFARFDSSEATAQFRTAALRVFSNPARRNAVRLDLALIVGLFALAVILWGAHWWVFAACVLLRWVVLSILDNAPHYATPLGSGLDARDTHMPWALRWLVMNGNYHGIHHGDANLHWSDLPGSFANSKRAYAGSWLVGVLRQFRGPVELG
jgi:fatty acid desaturase